MIHTDEIIARQMEMFEPVCPHDINRGTKEDCRRECKLVAIEVLKTGIIPEYSCREIHMVKEFLKEVNKVRQDLNVQVISCDVFNKKI